MGYLYQVASQDAAITFGWPASARERARLERDLLAVIDPALAAAAELAGVESPPSAGPLLAAFLAVHGRRPLAENKGGSGLNDSLWLFLVARLLDPVLLVESGTWRGQSAWLFRQACPAAEIVTFDHAALDEVARREPRPTWRKAVEASSLYAVLGPDGVVITTGHRYRRVVRDRSLASLRPGRSRRPPGVRIVTQSGFPA